MKTYKIFINIICCGIILLLGCSKNTVENDAKPYNSNQAFNEFIQNKFQDAYQNSYGFEEIDLEKFRENGKCRYYPKLNFQIIHFCPFLRCCYTIIEDIEQESFYMQDFISEKAYTKVFDNQLDSNDNETYYMVENQDNNVYLAISNVLNNRYGNALIPVNDFRDLVFFLSNYPNENPASFMSKAELKTFYHEELNNKNKLCQNKKEQIIFTHIFKEQINYVYAKMDNPYFLVVQYPEYSQVVTYELQFFDTYDYMSNKAKIRFPIKYNIVRKVYPVYN